MKVGRAALDEDAIRLLEELNPDVEFDWTRILKGEAPARPPEPPRQSGPKRAERVERGEPREPPDQRRAAPRPSPPAEPDAAESFAHAPAEEYPAEIEAEVPADSPPEEEPENVEIEAASPGEEILPILEPAVAETAAHARLGTESIVRLRGRYAEILTRITERIQDPVRRDELKFQADRLNPDTWVTGAEVTAGLEQYESVFESLRAIVGRRKRRRRRRGGRKELAGSTTVEGQAPDPDSSESDDAEEQ